MSESVAIPFAFDPTPRALPLSQREHEVLDLVRCGMTNRSAAIRLGISERTVREHVAQILLKLGVSSRVEAAVLATEWHLLRRFGGIEENATSEPTGLTADRAG